VGLGLKELKSSHQALMTKQVARMIMN